MTSSTTSNTNFQKEEIDTNKHPHLVRWKNNSVYFFDIPIVLLMALLVFIGLAMGLVAFFELQAKTSRLIRSEMKKSSREHAATFDANFKNFLTSIATLKSTFQVFASDYDASVSSSVMDIGPTEFETYLNSSKLMIQGFSSFGWIPKVSPSDRSAMVSSIRQYGGMYSVFDIYSYDDKLREYPLPDNYKNGDDFFPLLYSVPYDPSMFLDLSTEIGYRAVAIHKAIFARQPTISSRLIRGAGGLGFQVYDSVWKKSNDSELFGLVRGVFSLSELMASMGFDKLSVDIATFDNSFGLPPNETFLYDSKDGAANNSSDYYRDRSEFTSKQFCTSQIVSVADRNWTLYFIPQKSFLDVAKDAYYNQWIALFVLLGGILVVDLMLVAVIIAKHLIIKNYMQLAFRERVVALQDNNTKLETLLDRIAMEEHRTRGVMNAVPYAILVVNKEGKFLEFNKQFRTIFGKGEKGLSKLSFSQIFPRFKQPEQLFKESQNGTAGWARLDLLSKFGNTIPSEVSVAKSQAMVGSKEDHLYIIIINALESKIKSQMNRDYVDNEQLFNKTIQDPLLRSKFKNFCVSHHNAESIQFIEAVLDYKASTNTMERVQMQATIFDTFLKEHSKLELNIPRNLVNDDLAALQNGLGQPTVFDTIFNRVCTILMQDAFQQYCKETGMNSPATSPMTSPVSTPTSTTTLLEH